MRIERRELAAIGVVVAVFAAIRIPTLTAPAILLGWDSDAATFGLMAKRLYEHGELPIFFWGQSYMGPLTSYAAAALAVFRIEPTVGPLTLRLASYLLVLGGLAGYWFGLRRAFGRTTAALAALWLAIGPGHLFSTSFAPLGSEQLFFLSGLMFAHAMHGFPRRRDWLVFGLLAGIGWWIHQGIVFVAGATLLVVAWNAGMRLPPLPAHRGIRVANVVLLGWLLMNIVSSIAGTPAFFLYSALGEPLAAYAVFRSLFARPLLAKIDWRNVALGAGGFLIGYAPVMIGSWLGAFEWIYEFSVPPRELVDVPKQIGVIVQRDFWTFIGAERAPWSFAVGIGVVVLLLLVRRGDWKALPLAICGAALAFYVFSARAHPGSVRYVVPALPLVYAFAADGAVHSIRWKWIGAAAAIAVTAGLAGSRIEHVRDLRAARAEYSVGFDATWDPRPTLAAIERGGYTVCAADYWSAYKLEFLLGERVLFIVRRSYDRRPERTQVLRELPVRKCLVDAATGRVTDYDPKTDEGAISAAARERLRRAKR